MLKIKYGKTWSTYIIPEWKKSKVLPKATSAGRFGGAAVSVVDKLSNESTAKLLLPVLKQVEQTQ